MHASASAILGLMFAAALGAAGGVDEKSAPATVDADLAQWHAQRHKADDAVQHLIKAKDWREARGIQKELTAIGEAAVSPITRQAKKNDDADVRLRCFELLTEHYAKSSEEAIAHDGLMDESVAVRYHCAWHSGDLKLYGAHRRLRGLMEDAKQPPNVRHAATKSLAQLGEANVIGMLVKMMESDSYMPRYMGNLGAKALTGKDLNEFGGYDYGEGAFVSGGLEYMFLNEHPADRHEKLAKRHGAIAAYCKWLEQDQPAIFKHLYAPW
jgi:hypothetical protein